MAGGLRYQAEVRLFPVGLIMLALLAGCGGDDATPTGIVEPGPEVAWPNLECDPLVPSYCGYPFPSNVFTVPDADGETGLRVNLLDGTLPIAANGSSSSLQGLLTSDGFSTGSALIAELVGATLEGLPTPLTIEDSLAPDSPTVVIDAETGERIPHFSELDKSNISAEERVFLIRPVVRLRDATRYIVAIRNVQGANGPLAPSPAFAALRDVTAFDEDSSIDERRGLYADIFGRLENAGVGRGDLQLAWDFTTASRDNNTRLMLHMRDEALDAAGPDGPAYTITDVTVDPDPDVRYRIEGTMTAPLYLTTAEPGGRLVLDDDGLPIPNPEQPTREVPFLLLIPPAAEQEPAALLQYGHGLLGSLGQVEGFKSLSNEYNYAIFGLTLIGMGDDDGLWISEKLSAGAVDELTAMFERQHQGMLEYLLAMRMMSRGFATDPTYGALIDPAQRYYHGISQGGIFGGTYMALSTDVTRGVLGVMGMSYNLLLNRSVDFSLFFTFLNISFPSPRDQQFLLSLVQSFWDRTEPNGYAPYIRDDTLPGTPEHEVLMRAAIGDHQVTTLGGHIMARAVGAQHLDSGQRSLFGLDAVDAANSGSAYVEYDFGLPPEPLCNIPMTACEDPHGEIRKLDEAKGQLDAFLRSGEIVNLCAGGACSFPDLGGCAPDETTPVCFD
jgi:hypothetical protein